MRSLLAAVVLCCLTAAAATAQYATPRPVPRSTSVPELRALAVRREIEERFTIGLRALARTDFTGAAAEFERIVALDPAEPQGSTARYDLALAYANVGRNADAATQLRAAIALDPGFLAAMANLVSVDLALGNLNEARRIADRYVALAPGAARALYARGIVALRGGDAATAREDFGKLLHVNPSYALAHYDLALAEEQLGRYDAAQRELEVAVTLAPNYARARFALGVVLLRQGRRADARDTLQRAAADSGGDAALANLATALRDSIQTP
jgi:tetratricopeptide (TPR) repeat protein